MRRTARKLLADTQIAASEADLPQIETDTPQLWRDAPELVRRVHDDLQAGEAMATAMMVREALLRLGRPGLAARGGFIPEACAA